MLEMATKSGQIHSLTKNLRNFRYLATRSVLPEVSSHEKVAENPTSKHSGREDVPWFSSQLSYKEEHHHSWRNSDNVQKSCAVGRPSADAMNSPTHSELARFVHHDESSIDCLGNQFSQEGIEVSPSLIPWMSVSVIHGTVLPQERSTWQFLRETCISKLGSRDYTSASRGSLCQLSLLGREAYHSRVHGKELLTIQKGKPPISTLNGKELLSIETIQNPNSLLNSEKRSSIQIWQNPNSRLNVYELSSIRVWHSPRRSHGGHAHGHHGVQDKTGKDGERVLGLGLWGDILLALGKGGAGYVSGSMAIIADAAHSVSDIALSGVALWTSKVANTPKDKQHPYGHGKFETVGALGISGMLLLTAGGIAWNAVETLQPFIPMLSDFFQSKTDNLHKHAHGEGGGHHHGIDLQHPFVALTAAVLSIGVKERLYWQTIRVGEQQQSELLKASAWHHRSDAISSVVALFGVGGAMLGMPLLDPLAGLLVSIMIMKAGLETGYQSLQDLVDSGVQESVLSPIRETVLHVQGVEGCHHLRGRRMGSFIHVDAHIEVNPWLSVSAAHNIGEAVRHQLHKQHPEVAETFVHIEPADGGAKTLTHFEAEIEHDHHDDSQDSHAHHHESCKMLNLNSFSKKDLTKEGSKSDLMKRSHSNEDCAADNFESDLRQHPDVEQDVRHVVGANFHEKMSITHVTSHFLQGKVVVEVEVSMNPDISVRNAMDYAHDAEQAILQRISDISAVRVQLKLNKDLSQSM